MIDPRIEEQARQALACTDPDELSQLLTRAEWATDLETFFRALRDDLLAFGMRHEIVDAMIVVVSAMVAERRTIH